MDSGTYTLPASADTDQPPRTIMVWDLPLRLFHWAMVVVVAVAGITGFLAPEWWLDIHVIAGYALGILLAFRLVWGFLGSRYSRFSSFPLSRAKLRGYLRSILRWRPLDHIGHNPVGAWMIVILLIVLVSLVISGLVLLGGQENLGPLAAATSHRSGEFAEEFHEFAAWVLVGAVAVHLLGVLAETVVFRRPVVTAMITGNTVAKISPPDDRVGSRAIWGGVVFLAVAALLLGAGATLAGKPPSGWRQVRTPAVYASECGDCHDAYHPSLRTKPAWRAIMAGLPDHFGEDASLDPETANRIGRFLDANHARTFDTEAARNVGPAETGSLRMTDTGYWKQRHRDLDPAVFRLPAVGSKVNCESCHTDAASGRFDDAKIQLPAQD